MTTILTKKLMWLYIVKIKLLDCMLFIFLIYIVKFFFSIEYYLLFDS